MADPSDSYKKRMTKTSEAYEDPENGNRKRMKNKKAVQSPSYAPQSSKRAKAYRKQLDEATGW